MIKLKNLLLEVKGMAISGVDVPIPVVELLCKYLNCKSKKDLEWKLLDLLDKVYKDPEDSPWYTSREKDADFYGWDLGNDEEDGDDHDEDTANRFTDAKFMGILINQIIHKKSGNSLDKNWKTKNFPPELTKAIGMSGKMKKVSRNGSGMIMKNQDYL